MVVGYYRKSHGTCLRPTLRESISFVLHYKSMPLSKELYITAEITEDKTFSQSPF